MLRKCNRALLSDRTGPRSVELCFRQGRDRGPSTGPGHAVTRPSVWELARNPIHSRRFTWKVSSAAATEPGGLSGELSGELSGKLSGKLSSLGMKLARSLEAQLWLLTAAFALARSSRSVASGSPATGSTATGSTAISSTTSAESLLGMEFDGETGEELLKAYLPPDVPPDNSILTDLQKLSDAADTTIVLMADKPSVDTRKEPVVVYQIGKSEQDLAECSSKGEVCSKVDLYGDPWVERQCRCSSGRSCSHSLHAEDGHTIVDKSRQYKLCEPVKHLPICRYFKDITWTITPGIGPNNSTVQKVHCRCRPGSVSYLVRRQYFGLPDGSPSFVYSFACSPQSRMRCQAKEPCRLFTVHKKTSSQLEEVNASPLCQCSKGFRCPRRHTEPGSLPSSYYGDGLSIKVYSGHCVPVRHNEPIYTLVK